METIKHSDLPYFSLNGIKTNGKVVHVYDGDTCSIVFSYKDDLVKFKCRLKGIDASEMNSQNELALKARDFLITLVTNIEKIPEQVSRKELQQLIDNNTKLIEIHCFGFDKYGRLLVVIYDGDVSVNDKMLQDGYAVID